MKKTLLTLIVALMTLGGVYGQDTKAPTASLFNAGEVGLSLGSGYVVETSAPFKQDYSFNLIAGAHYFPTKYVGVQAFVPFYATKGVSVTEAQAGLTLRLPIGFVAPYIGGNGLYNWNADSEWAYVGRGGLEVRVNSKVGIFAEGQYRNNTFKNWDKGAVSVVGGVKFNF
jgi:hypothetical protein